jgi:hypothetical protein
MSTAEIVSLGVSVVTGLITAYFWLIASREARPRLDVRWRGVRDTYEHQDDPDPPADGAEPAPGPPPPHYVAVVAQWWVSNLSTRPNALLGIRLQVRDRDGNWIGTAACPGRKTYPKPAATVPPVMLPPRDMVEVDAYIWIAVAPETLERFRGSSGYWEPFAASVSSPVEFQVEITGLHGRTFVCRVLAPKE